MGQVAKENTWRACTFVIDMVDREGDGEVFSYRLKIK
jgi:hypothetical protein